MSKSNADFSAFDFNDDSSDDSDVPTPAAARGSYLSRTNLTNNHNNNNNNSNNSNNLSNNNNNNNNNSTSTHSRSPSGNSSSASNNNSQHANDAHDAGSSKSNNNNSNNNKNNIANGNAQHANSNNKQKSQTSKVDGVGGVGGVGEGVGDYGEDADNPDNDNAAEENDDFNDNCSQNSNELENCKNQKLPTNKTTPTTPTTATTTLTTKTNKNVSATNTKKQIMTNGQPTRNDVDDDDDETDGDDDDEEDDDGDGEDDEDDDDDDDDDEDVVNDGGNAAGGNSNSIKPSNVTPMQSATTTATPVSSNQNVGNSTNFLENAGVSGLLENSSQLGGGIAVGIGGVAGSGGAGMATSTSGVSNFTNNSALQQCTDTMRSNSSNASFSNSAKLNNNSNSLVAAAAASLSAAAVAAANERRKYRHQNYSKNIYIGTKNAEKWEHTRTRLQFKNDVEFVAYLLTLADKDTDRLANLPPPSAPATPTKSFAGNFKLEPNLSVKEFAQSENSESQPAPKKKSKKRVQFSDALNGFPKIKDFANFAAKAKKHEQKSSKAAAAGSAGTGGAASSAGANSDTLPEVLDCRIAEKIKSELEEKSATTTTKSNVLCLKKGDSFEHGSDDDGDGDEDTNNLASGATPADTIDGLNGQGSNSFRVRVKTKKQAKVTFGGINAAATIGGFMGGDDDDDGGGGGGADDTDDDDEEMDEEALAREIKNEQNFVEEDDEHEFGLRSQQTCRECSITHDFKLCPLRNAACNITDAVDLAEWIERKNLEALARLKADAQRHAKQAHEDDDEDMDDTSQMSELETKPLITFAEASVPAEFDLHNLEPNVTGVFVRSEVRAFTKLGPLIGQPILSNDVREGSDMKWIFEICEAGDEKSQLICCDNPNTSNWLRYIRPAPAYEERTVNLVSIDRQAYFVTCRDVKNGMELLYWSDDCNTMWRKKQTDKLTCGGCNLKFDHQLYYRTHCSIFHDPSMSLTIRKYHCKVCGDAVLGKENIMKHAAEMHDGKGAYQCQFCNKFFLRLNYLEIHRTYGCSANPNRARPLCDFCGRKFCQPQKLKAHIKRMHSGSRAALQRHSKEVHSRNSTVVSCPRCQKLFQNRSNLKIHMLTHSGVRPFKCAEPECNAAFTTKQCLQFHYKKVHNYTQEQMPKIERSVAYTFDAYSGGMKVDFLEQAPRRRRKSLEDQNSMLSSSLHSDAEMSDDNIFEAIKKSGKSIKDLCRNEPNLSLLSSKMANIFGEKVVGSRKRKKKKEPNTSSNLLGGNVGAGVVGVGPGGNNDDDDDEDRLEQVRRKQNAQLSLVETFLTTTAQRLSAQQQVQQVVAAAAAVSAMASGNTDEAAKMHMMSNLSAQHMAMGGAGHGLSGMPNDDDDDDDDDDDEDVRDGSHHGLQQGPLDGNSYRHHASMNALGQNLVVSKGSKKWISGDERHMNRDCAAAMGGGDIATAASLAANAGVCGMPGAGNANELPGLPNFAVPPGAVDDPGKLLGQNRDFLARLMNSANASHTHHNANNREEDENSSFLDVVESNNNAGAAAQLQHYHQNNATSGGNANANAAGANINNVGSIGNLTNSAGETEQTAAAAQMQMNPLTHPQSFMSSFYNNANARLTGTGSNASTSASMLVEAALNSVGNIMDNENSDLKVPTENNINTDSPMSSHVDSESNRFAGASTNNAINNMDTLENELKMMKNLSSFPMQIPALPLFQNATNNMSSCNISPNASTPTNPQSNQNNNDVDVDAGSTPRPQHMGNSTVDSDAFSTPHHRTPPSPPPISPGRDYGGLFGANAANGTPGGTASSTSSANSAAGNSTTNNISATSPLPSLQAQRRNASSVGSTYPDHELISPASSPSIPRYNFNGDVMRHKRMEHEAERRQTLPGASNHLSSDEENSIMPHNSAGQDMRMKFSQSQMDLMYSKYESMTNAANLKYANQEIDSPIEFRNSNNSSANISSAAAAAAASAAASASEMSDLQGLDMSSRSNLSASNYHHNFQLPSSAATSNIPGIGRYHHHIYDILSEREQSQQSQTQSQQQQQHHSAAAVAAAAAAAQHQQQQEHSSQLAMQQHHQSAMHNMLPDQLNDQDHDQTTSVDLSRTANYVVSSPPQLPYNHPHHDMLRMASLDLTPNTNMSVGNNRSFLSSQMPHQSRESLEHHRLLSTVEQHRLLAASNAAAAADQHRLLVDPTAHLLMEQNNRLLGSDQSRLLGDSAQNRHMARSFGAYHQVASGNYHPGVRPPVLPSANHHSSNPSNYHPFPAYY